MATIRGKEPILMAEIQGHKTATVDELQQPGDFCFWHVSEDGQSAFMAFKCPCGTEHQRSHDSIPVRIGAPQPAYHWYCCQ